MRYLYPFFAEVDTRLEDFIAVLLPLNVKEIAWAEQCKLLLAG